MSKRGRGAVGEAVGGRERLIEEKRERERGGGGGSVDLLKTQT